MNLTIDRQRWLRGEGHQRSMLLRKEDGKMCCLGFYYLALGVLPEKIENIPSPLRLNDNDLRELPGWLLDTGVYSVVQQLMHKNDHCPLSELDREREIKKLFAQEGVNITFVD